MKIVRLINAPIRQFIDMDHRWRGPDKGLIWCWEKGRELSIAQPELAAMAQAGELPLLGWTGGVVPELKLKKKEGTLYYLAQWQGLAGKDLTIETEASTVLVCSKTRVEVTYSANAMQDEPLAS